MKTLTIGISVPLPCPYYQKGGQGKRDPQKDRESEAVRFCAIVAFRIPHINTDPVFQTIDELNMLISSIFNDTATTEIYTLSLHDALPILLEVFLYAI